MGKSSKKTQSNKSSKVAPTWRQQLAECNINSVYEGRTCEIIFMCELTPHFSEALPLFHAGSKSSPTHVVKSINFTSFTDEISASVKLNLDKVKSKSDKGGKSKSDSGKTKSNQAMLFQPAAAEAIEYLNNNQPIPVELMAQLLKLKIVTMINEDVTLRDEERLLEIEKSKPVEVDTKGKKGKIKPKDAKKGKSKVTSLPMEKRCLYFIINGFYDNDLIEELWKIGIALGAVLELAKLDEIFKEKYDTTMSKSSSSDGLESSDNIDLEDDTDDDDDDDDEVVLYVNNYFAPASKDSFGFAALDKEQSVESESSIVQVKLGVLYNFWNKMYKQIEGELQAKFLESAAHIRVCPLSAVCFDPDQSDEQALAVFAEITKEVLRIPDVKGQHENYLRHLGVHSIKHEANLISVDSLKTYRKLMDAVPSDCFTITLFLHCLLEEVCTRKAATKSKLEEECAEEEAKHALLNNLAAYVIQCNKRQRPLCKTNVNCRKSNAKTKLTISKTPFVIHETSWLELKLNSYPELSSWLRKIHVNTLKLSPAALLWRQYPRLNIIELIYRNHQLETWQKKWNFTKDELHYAISSVEFDSIPCSTPKKPIKIKNQLQKLFLNKNNSWILESFQPKIKYMQTPDVSQIKAIGTNSQLEPPSVTYTNKPNIYEAKNISAHVWYEDLDQIVILQQLCKAQIDFLCVDHKYSPYNDTILLRYHNNVDSFGVNVKIWSESIRTPICFRDFCKYVIHDEIEWLEKAEEENPYEFLAFDLGEARIQLTGATTTFHSLDNFKITVDSTNFIGNPPQLSLNIKVAQHNFILHYNRTKVRQRLMFHLALFDGTIMVFSKPPTLNKPDVSIAENIHKSAATKAKPDVNSSYQRREPCRYYIKERRYYFKRTKTPFVASRVSLVPESLKSSFLRHVSKSKHEPKLVDSTMTDVYGSNGNRSSKILESSFIPTNVQKNDLAAAMPTECERVLRKIKDAKKLQIPLFRVYSSKLHRFDYIKRIKSYIHIRIKQHTISLKCKHPCYKFSRDIEIVKVFPVRLNNVEFYNRSCYDMKTSLPSGLVIYTIPGIDNSQFNIVQKYIETGPQHKNIIEEDSRTYLQDGNVVIKKRDGTLDIYTANGHIIRCEIPYTSIKTHVKYKAKKKQKSITNFAIPLYIVNRRRRHIIGGVESRYWKQRRNILRPRKQIYVMQQNSNPFHLQYKLITQDGQKLKVSEVSVKKEGQIFQVSHMDDIFEEQIFLRDDGMTNLLYGGGIVTTQFSDQTRISSWFTEATEFVIIDDEENFSQVEEEFFEYSEPEEWVMVQMYYKHEHPNYATILFNGSNYEVEITLPNNVVISVTDKGDYYLEVDPVVSVIINDELVYLESRSCKSCMQRGMNIVNIKPLYDRIYPIPGGTELLKSCDSYEKVFIVNYDGRCFRNSNFIRGRNNRVECRQHDKGDYQRLFVLNRDLTGTKLWDVKAYHERFMKTLDNPNTVFQYYGKEKVASIEIRTYEYKPYHEYFLNRNFLSDFSLTSYQVALNPQRPAYTTIFHAHWMPEQSSIDALHCSMLNTNCEKMEFPQSDDNKMLCKCLSQIARLNQKPVTVERESVTSTQSLHDRWYAWHELNQPYTPSHQICACKTDLTDPTPRLPKQTVNLAKDDEETLKQIQPSLVEIADRISSDSFIEPYIKTTTACICKVPADFICECKPKIVKAHSDEIEYDQEARQRLLLMRHWSQETFFGNLYVSSEQVPLNMVEAKSVSDTVIQARQLKTRTCPCNVRKKIHIESSQNDTVKAAPKMCGPKTCNIRQTREFLEANNSVTASKML